MRKILVLPADGDGPVLSRLQPAGGVPDVMARVQKGDVGVVVVDTGPVGDADVAFIGRLRRMDPRLQVVAITPRDDEDGRRQVRSAGVHHCAVGRMRARELRDVLESALACRRHAGAAAWSAAGGVALVGGLRGVGVGADFTPTEEVAL